MDTSDLENKIDELEKVIKKNTNWRIFEQFMFGFSILSSVVIGYYLSFLFIGLSLLGALIRINKKKYRRSII